MAASRGTRGRTRSLAFERLEPRVALDASMLRLSEFLASNDDGLTDFDGDASDWIEIYNSGSTNVNLSGMYLSDNALNRTKWQIPAGVSLAGGGYLVVFASSKNTVKPNGELHTNFALSAGGEYLGLTAVDGTTVIDQYASNYPAQREDVSYGQRMTPTGGSSTLIGANASAVAWVPTSAAIDGVWRDTAFNAAVFNISGPAGFGYENSPSDPVNYTSEISTVVPSGTLSLYMRVPFTLSALTGVDRLTLRMRYDDGFVAYLNGVKVAEANAPDETAWNSQAAGDHSDALAEQYEDFDVSAAIPQLVVGQNVLAIHAMNVPASSDMLASPLLVATASAIATPPVLGYFQTPTPGYANGDSVLGFVAEPTFSVPHGFYSTQQVVGLATSTPGATIVYTTDGSTPAVDANLAPTTGSLYTGPIAVSSSTILRAIAFRSGYQPSFVVAGTYLFVADVLAQSPLGQTPAGWPADGTNGHAMDYGIDPNVIASYGSQAVANSLLSLPSISITTDLSNLFDSDTGIYLNPTNDGRSWERPASVELLEPGGGAGFTVNAGLRIRGGFSRTSENPKHSLRLYFRGEYGDGKLDFPLFGSEGAADFDVLDLRTEQDYSWSLLGNTQNTFVREVFSRDLQRDLAQPYTRSRYYHLYLDGKYWGIYQTQERIEEYYGESYLGGNEADYDVIKSALYDGGGFQVSAGTDAAWQTLFSLAQGIADNPAGNANNFWTLQGLNPDGTRNPSLPVLLDASNLADYMLIIFYTGGFDVGRSNNWQAIYNRVAADGGFKFFMHDNEQSLGAWEPPRGSQSIDTTGPYSDGNESTYAGVNPTYLHQDLLAHPDYAQLIRDKVQRYFFSNGPMSPASSAARLAARVSQVDPAIIAESARWGDAQTEPALNKAVWQDEINWLQQVYFPNRTSIVLNQLRSDRLYVVAPTFSQQGGLVPAGFGLTMAVAGGGPGKIYYSTDRSVDPRAFGGAVNSSPAVHEYVGAVAIAGDATIRARFRTSAGNWSALIESSFTTVKVGDYNRDGTVEGSDFLFWQRALGTAAAPAGSGADGNFNGLVDSGDLTTWADALGQRNSITSRAQSLAAPSLAMRDKAYASLAAIRIMATPQLAASSRGLGAIRRELPSGDHRLAEHGDVTPPPVIQQLSEVQSGGKTVRRRHKTVWQPDVLPLPKSVGDLPEASSGAMS